jgi:predicted  nucleic acid-binding Zn-ribbon protein
VSSEYAGYETMPEEPFAPTKYRILFRCLRCGHTYFKVAKSPNIPDVPCPKSDCRQAIRSEEIRREALKLAQMLEEQRPPAQIGNKVVVKAIDETAKVVMEDYKLTDLKDNIRHGEAAAPKLPAPMQKAADNFFNVPVQNSRRAKQMELLGKRAIAGAFRNTALNPTAIVGGKAGESPLRFVRKEQIRDR